MTVSFSSPGNNRCCRQSFCWSHVSAPFLTSALYEIQPQANLNQPFFFFLTWHIVKTPAGRFFFWGGAASPAFNQDVLTNRCRISLFNKASFILTLHITATAWLEERKDRGKYISQGLGGVQMAYFTWTGCVYSCPSPLHVHTLTQHRDTSRGWIFPRFSHCLFLTTISLASIIRYCMY